jgi:DNA (cytosine-5)-methyltransferase 1
MNNQTHKKGDPLAKKGTPARKSPAQSVLPAAPTGKFTLIDLFAGAGGMTLGFRKAGFEPILAVEKEPDFAATYAANFGAHVLSGDIAQLLEDGKITARADVVIGGPPCQGFSNLTGNRAADPRRGMWRYFMDVVESSGCKVFVIENVPNILTSEEGKLILERALELGFEVAENGRGILKASDYGVPQNRRRAFIIGSRIGPISLPPRCGETKTVREALKGIPKKPLHRELVASPASGSDLHIGRNPTKTSLERYKLIPEGGNRFDLQRLAPHITPNCWLKKKEGGTDLFGRLLWDEPARCTIRCEFYKPEKGRYLHPQEHRPITHWEAARIQSFPDTFKWCGSKIRIAIQIGNAVPPDLAYAVAIHIRAHLSSASCARNPRSSQTSTSSVKA